jgi:hypothetical protein
MGGPFLMLMSVAGQRMRGKKVADVGIDGGYQ